MFLRLNGKIYRVYLTAIFAIVFFSFPIILFSQNYTVSGKIIDSQTREPLAFVNILVNKNIQVTQSDIDGVFQH